MRMLKAVQGAAALVAAMAIAGCTLLSPRHDPSRFYTLAPRERPAAPAPAGREAGPSILVGPVTFPAYLDRNEVAIRVSPSELKYAVAERWAEPLVQNFTRVLVEDLGNALGSDRVAGLTANAGLVADFAIEVVVVRFEATDDGSAQLTARWAVRDHTRKILRIRQSQHQRQATTASIEGGVNALSAALGDLADEMAATVRDVRAEQPNRSAP